MSTTDKTKKEKEEKMAFFIGLFGVGVIIVLVIIASQLEKLNETLKKIAELFDNRVK